MIAFEEDCLTVMAPFQQEVERVTGIGTTIDVVAEVDFDRAVHRAPGQIGVNFSKHLLKEIGAPVDIAEGINAYSLG